MSESLQGFLLKKISKADFISYIKTHPLEFESAIQLALTDKQHVAWRAAWMVGHCMAINDKRINTYLNSFIEAIKDKKDGHQRELLKIIDKMEVTENHEGLLFDICITIWEQINKSSSVRIIAFKTLLKIANKYPELKNELTFLLQDHYTETLSPGIANSFDKMKNQILKI